MGKSRLKILFIVLVAPVVLLLVCLFFTRVVFYIDVEGHDDISLELSAPNDAEIVVFSDTHLDCNYDAEKAEYLKSIIEPADFVIINGDFWDYYQCDFEDFVNSDYQSLFSALLSKETVYLYGNHDLMSFSDGRVNLFSDFSGHNLKLAVGENVYYFEHGNRIYKSWEEEYPYFLRNRPAIQLGGRLESLGVQILGEGFYEDMYKDQNILVKENAVETMGEDEILFTGHTHLAELDLADHFANDGLIRHGDASYILIEGGEIKLVTDSY